VPKVVVPAQAVGGGAVRLELVAALAAGKNRDDCRKGGYMIRLSALTVL